LGILSKNSDQELLVCLRQGDIKAFDELYFRYSKRLMAFALTFFSDTELAKEAVQVIFIRIWERRRELETSKSFKVYLFQAVRYYMYNYVRDKKHSCALDEVPENVFLRENQVEDDLAYEALEATAYSLIEKLPKVQQRVFRLNKLEGLSPAEIAVKMNLSQRTIEHHIYLATKSVKGALLKHATFSTMLFVALNY